MQPRSATEKCTQCKVNDLDTEGYPKWCKSCRARYKREQRVLESYRTETKGLAIGYRRGKDDMRQAAIEHFERFRYAHFSGYEISKMLAIIPDPILQDERSTEAQPAASGG